MQTGRQHAAFQPALLNLPSPYPTELNLIWDYIEDEEFTVRMTRKFGDASVVKLRYMIAKFDVGVLEGGLQSRGQAEGQASQTAQSAEAIEAWPEDFGWRKHDNRKGRLSKPRARIKVDRHKVKNSMIEGRPAGEVISRAVSMKGV